MKKIMLSLMLGLFLLSFASAGSRQMPNMSIIDGLFDNSIIENNVWINGTWNGAWWSNPCGYVKDDFLNKDTICSEIKSSMYYTEYFEDEVKQETKKKPDGSACITKWICENGEWIKEDWMHPKRIQECITNYNAENCAVAEKYWSKIIPGKYCIVLNDNGIGLKPKPTTPCEVKQETNESEDEFNVLLGEGEKVEIIIENHKKPWWKRIFFWLD